MNKSSIEKARAEFHGNEFGKYDNPAPSPWAGILWLWAILVVVLGALVWLYGCTPAVADVPAEAQEMNRAFNSPACKHKSTEARMQCAIDKTQGA